MTYANDWSTNKGQLINKNPKYGKNWNRFASIPLAFSVSTCSLAHPSPYVLWACAYRPLFVLFDDFIYTIYGLISFLAISNQYALRFSVNFAFLFVAIFGVCHALLLRLLLFCLHIICYVSCVCVCVILLVGNQGRTVICIYFIYQIDFRFIAFCHQRIYSPRTICVSALCEICDIFSFIGNNKLRFEHFFYHMLYQSWQQQKETTTASQKLTTISKHNE